MKAYLKSSEGTFQLAPKVTTIGREGCDLIIQSPTVEVRHTEIEFTEQEKSFVLRDLNTAKGTQLNGCRAFNKRVLLNHGDYIRFGDDSTFYKLIVGNMDNPQQLHSTKEEVEAKEKELAAFKDKFQSPEGGNPKDQGHLIKYLEKELEKTRQIALKEEDETPSNANTSLPFQLTPSNDNRQTALQLVGPAQVDVITMEEGFSTDDETVED